MNAKLARWSPLLFYIAAIIYIGRVDCNAHKSETILIVIIAMGSLLGVVATKMFDKAGSKGLLWAVIFYGLSGLLVFAISFAIGFGRCFNPTF